MLKTVRLRVSHAATIPALLLIFGLAAMGCDDPNLKGTTPPATESGGKAAGESCSDKELCATGLDCVDAICQTQIAENNNGNSPNNNNPNNPVNNNPGTNNDPGNPNVDCPKKNVCGNCDADCHVGTKGPAGETPFDPNAPGNNGVVTDENGNITIEMPGMGTKKEYIWIANTGQGTISKVDTKTYEEVGRYLTGPKGTGNDPSRTSVDTYSDVYVGNRGGGSITKIGNGATCVDKNGDGEIQTSTGADNILPWGEDECVLWNTDLPSGGLIRAVAAQDGQDGPVVWAGGYAGVVWKLDGKTGQVLLKTASPVPTYGFAIDKKGNLWMASLSAAIGRLDTNRCVDEASCAEAVCTTDGDNCVKQKIATPGAISNYGITVDFKQRIWLGGYIGLAFRYDPAALPDDRLVVIQGLTNIHGIAADDKGWVYGAAMGQGLFRINADNPQEYKLIDGTNGASGGSMRGVGIALDGKVWAINYTGAGTAFVIEPGPGIDDAQVIHTQTGFVSPYTYSDMTGSQLRLATNRQGIYTETFEGCSEEYFHHNEWEELHYQIEVPEGASVKIRIRAAYTRQALDTAAWIDAAEIPAASSPLDIKSILEPLGLHRHQFLQVEIQMNAFRDENMTAVPVLKNITTRADCPLIIG